AGEIIAEVETDKATMEMESFEAGTLASIAVKEGGKAPVGATIAILAASGEKLEDVKKQAGTAAASSGSGQAPATTADKENAAPAGKAAKPDKAPAASQGGVAVAENESGSDATTEGGQVRTPANVDYGGPGRIE